MFQGMPYDDPFAQSPFEDLPTMELTRGEALSMIEGQDGPPALPFPLLRRKSALEDEVFELLPSRRADRPSYLALR